MFPILNHLEVNEKGHLIVGKVDTVELAEKFGTPLFVLNEMRVRENYRNFYNAFAQLYSKILVCYAYKANTSLAVCKILQQEGAGAEVFSGGELFIAQKVGVEPQKIVYNGINKTEEELKAATNYGVGLINIDSINDLQKVNRFAQKFNKKIRIGIRVNPAVSPKTHKHIATGLRKSKFGLDIKSNLAFRAYEMAKEMPNLEIVGIHTHIGSQITTLKPFVEATNKIMDFIGVLKKKLNIDLQFVNLGGGLGIQYERDVKAIAPSEFAQAIVSVVREKIQEFGLIEPTLVFEPGRFIVGDAEILLLRVGCVKETPGVKKFAIVDGGINLLIRPILYNAYHEVVVANKANQPAQEAIDIVGPLCEASDVLAQNRVLPKIDENDIVAVLNAGAYVLAMSSQYISHPRAAEVLVKEGRAELIRKRETFENLIENQILPSHLGS